MYEETLQAVRDQGGKILFGGEVIEMNEKLGNFVVPTICEFENVAEITKSEAFVPILYTMKFKVNQCYLHLTRHIIICSRLMKQFISTIQSVKVYPVHFSHPTQQQFSNGPAHLDQIAELSM